MAIAVAITTARSRAAPAAPTAPTTEEWLRCAHTRCCGRTGSYSELPPGRCCISHPSAPSASLSCVVLTAVQGRSSSCPVHSLSHRAQGMHRRLVTLFLLPSPLHAHPKSSFWQLQHWYPWECLTAPHHSTLIYTRILILTIPCNTGLSQGRRSQLLLLLKTVKTSHT